VTSDEATQPAHVSSLDSVHPLHPCTSGVHARHHSVLACSTPVNGSTDRQELRSSSEILPRDRHPGLQPV
jgi:hypothetical protein